MVTVNKYGTDFRGLTLEYDYRKGYIHISMPEYVQTSLTKLDHNPPYTATKCNI